MDRKLRRIRDPEIGWLGGVCSGLAYFFGIPLWIVRLTWALLFFGAGAGGIVYVLLWIFLPVWDSVPKDFFKVTGD